MGKVPEWGGTGASETAPQSNHSQRTAFTTPSINVTRRWQRDVKPRYSYRSAMRYGSRGIASGGQNLTSAGQNRRSTT